MLIINLIYYLMQTWLINVHIQISNYEDWLMS